MSGVSIFVFRGAAKADSPIPAIATVPAVAAAKLMNLRRDGPEFTRASSGPFVPDSIRSFSILLFLLVFMVFLQLMYETTFDRKSIETAQGPGFAVTHV
jgi:hypothetical protein